LLYENESENGTIKNNTIIIYYIMYRSGRRRDEMAAKHTILVNNVKYIIQSIHMAMYIITQNNI